MLPATAVSVWTPPGVLCPRRDFCLAHNPCPWEGLRQRVVPLAPVNDLHGAAYTPGKGQSSHFSQHMDISLSLF